MVADSTITYEALYELLRREKSKEELQQLDARYIGLVLDYLRDVESRIGSVDPAGIFASDHEQLQNQFRNARRLVKELYERRERKILDLALNRSRTGSELVDTSNLLPEEQAFFDMLVASMDGFRKGVLGNVLSLRPPEQALLGNVVTVSRKEAVKDSVQQDAQLPHPDVAEPAASLEKPVNLPEMPASEKLPDGMRRVKFLAPVEQFVGQELELYGPFQAGEEAVLPLTVADILFTQGSACEAK